MFLGLVLVFLALAIGLALVGVALVVGFGGASIPFIAIGLSQRTEIRAEKAKEYKDVPAADGRQDWHLKLREMRLGAQTGEPSDEVLDPAHSLEILD